uniref:hypothetical protein n=1 Tax=Limnohabitans sp. TaxID=1907725 RepID=UPI0040470BB2
MTPLYQAMLSQAVSGQMLSVREVSQFSAAEIRQTMADLVADNRVDLANALAAAGQSLYPESEDILAISALLAEIQQDWIGSEELLRKLVVAQGNAATPFTWRHLIRVLQSPASGPTGAAGSPHRHGFARRVYGTASTGVRPSAGRRLGPNALSAVNVHLSNSQHTTCN